MTNRLQKIVHNAAAKNFNWPCVVELVKSQGKVMFEGSDCGRLIQIEFDSVLYTIRDGAHNNYTINDYEELKGQGND